MIKNKKKYNIKYLYHYTKKCNVDKILKDKKFKSSDEYIFFTGTLRDAITTFEDEMMSNNYYIDLDLKLKRRNYASKDDYVILKVPYIEDNKFYEFDFNNKNSIYNKSIIHNGFYKFKEIEVLDFPHIQNNKFKLALAKCALFLAIFLPSNVLADSWMDDSNYDISWYDPSLSMYNLMNAQDLAGLLHLVNEENVTFENKAVIIKNDISLVDHDWVAISDIFNGAVCGAHRILLKSTNHDLFENVNSDFTIAYYYPVEVILNGLTNNTFITSDETVGDFKNRLNGLGLLSSRDILVYNGNVLSDDTNVLSGINDNDKFYIHQGYIFFKQNNGTYFGITCETGDSIERIRELVKDEVGIDINSFKMYYNDHELVDTRTLADYNIQRKSIITLKVKNSIIIETNVNGLTTVDKNSAFKNEIINLTIVPNNNYNLKQIKILNANNIDITNEVHYENNKFIMPEHDVKIVPTYEIINPQTGDSILLYKIVFLVSMLGFIISYCFFSKNKVKL